MESKSSTKPKVLAPHTYHVAAAGGAVVTFAALPGEATTDVGRITNVPKPDKTGSVAIQYWGAKNDVPNYREELIGGNNIVMALIERKTNIVCGQEWYAYQEKFQDDGSGMMKRIRDEVPMPEVAKPFFKKFKKTGRQLIGEAMKHSMAMPEFIRDGGGQIISIKSLEMKYVRAGKKNSVGDIPIWYWGNIWQKVQQLKQEERMMRELPVYNEAAPKKQNRFVLPLMQDLFSDGYYPIPAYWGGRHWINLSNIIPLFHLANLKHGQTPRWHVIIPHDFFWDYEAMNATSDPKKIAELLKEAGTREQAFIDDFNAVMTGIGNTGRTITTKSEMVEVMGGRYDKRIIIEKLDANLNDEALLKLYAASNVANVSSHALHPTLASVETAGKGIGSGTEVRTAFLLWLIIAAPAYRDLLQEVIELVKTENGWPADIHYAIRDAELTTLADNPGGMQPSETQIGA